MANDLKSRYLREFINEITYNNRNPRDIRVLKLLDDISTNPERTIWPDEKVYRCRLIKDSHKTGKTSNFLGLSAEDSFVPPPKATRDMRANYRYIPYLYCSDNPYISLAEVRPRIGAKVSIATIIVKEKLSLLDFTNRNKPAKMTEAKINLFADLSSLFSKPIAFEDDTTDYIPTQFIAEYAKNLGYDGIIFKSSLVPELDSEEGKHSNIVVFNYYKCEPIKSNVFTITSCQIDGKQTDNDPDKLFIKSPVTEILNILLGNEL